MVDRIRQLMEYKGLTSTQLADSIEVPRAIVSHILSGRNKPSLDVVVKIMSTYREVNRNWLLLGEGNMLIALASAIDEKSPAAPPKDHPLAAVKETKATAAPIEKVQETIATPLPPPSADKAIEQIMIFYMDKTFSTYRPS